jgi:uncharacterized protein YjbI with pentapeptide repeats
MSPKTDPTQMANRLVRLEEITPASEYAAYFSVSLAPLVAHLGLPIFNGYDDLDLLKFAFLTLPSGDTVTLTEYTDDPKTSLCVDLKRQQDIPQIIFDSCQKLKISRSEIEWIHKDWREEVDFLYAEHGEIESINRPDSLTVSLHQEREPIDYFYYALEIYPRDRIPEYWAMLQHNLGLAYYHRDRGERWRNLQESIACFNRSLEVFTQAEFPKKWQINREDLDRSTDEWKKEQQTLIRDIRNRPGETSNLSGANLREANLSEVDLSGANLSEVNLIRANLNGANLNGSFLTKADLIEANLHKTNLHKTNLYRTNLCGANLREANLSEADLSGANLREANLSGADLISANVENTIFGGNNIGISETMRQDLISRGAIFEDLPGERSSSPAPLSR